MPVDAVHGPQLPLGNVAVPNQTHDSWEVRKNVYGRRATRIMLDLQVLSYIPGEDLPHCKTVIDELWLGRGTTLLLSAAAGRNCMGQPSLYVGEALFRPGGPDLELHEVRHPPLAVHGARNAETQVRAQTRLFKALKSGVSTGWVPQDAVGEVALTPPSEVAALAPPGPALRPI